MKVLIAHPTPFAQFGELAHYLIAQGCEVRFAHRFGPDAPVLDGIPLERFAPGWETVVRRGALTRANDYAGANALGFLRLALRLRDGGYAPDIVLAHCGWGVGLCVKDVWPDCRYIAYHEWYYAQAAKRRAPAETRDRLKWAENVTLDRLRNLPIAAEFLSADESWTPTAFQAAQFPPALRAQLQVVPDGVDADFFRPDPATRLVIDGLDLSHVAQIVTYSTRGMEPIRGFPHVMKALARLQRRLPEMHAVIAGHDAVYYGDTLGGGDTWRSRMFRDLDLDLSRVHFTGFIARTDYRTLLQASSAHVYFTEPFVTSWSLTEALMAGCLVVGSDTAPVREFIRHEETGFLVDINDTSEIVETLEWCLTAPEACAPLRAAARAEMLSRYAASHVMPARLARMRSLVGLPEEERRVAGA